MLEHVGVHCQPSGKTTFSRIDNAVSTLRLGVYCHLLTGNVYIIGLYLPSCCDIMCIHIKDTCINLILIWHHNVCFKIKAIIFEDIKLLQLGPLKLFMAQLVSPLLLPIMERSCDMEASPSIDGCLPKIARCFEFSTRNTHDFKSHVS